MSPQAREKGYADMFSLKNKNGLSLEMLEYGAVLRSLIVPDRNGEPGDIVLGYDGEAGYRNDRACMGATIGRYANRIANASFELNGVTYTLPRNEGNNCLHGGEGFHKRKWTGSMTEKGIRMSLVSPDGDQGFPGTLKVDLDVTLDDSNRLTLDYTAVSDADTVINLTNHSYFNLACGGTVETTELYLASDEYLPTGPGLIPQGEPKSVEGSEYDFRARRPIREPIYDNCFVLRPGDGVKAEAYDPLSGRGMRMYTDMPAVQLYSAVWLGGTEGKNGSRYGRGSAFCLETQFYPDAPNRPDFPSALLKAGEVFSSRTVFEFFTV